MGLRYVLGGRTKHIFINGMNSATGMQFANMDRKTFRNNNLYFTKINSLLRTTNPILGGQEALVPYSWDQSTWHEITSNVVGLFAWGTSPTNADTGPLSSQYIHEIISSHEGRAIASFLWKCARSENENDVTELQVHNSNTKALRYFNSLGGKICREWSHSSNRSQEPSHLVTRNGGSIHIPQKINVILSFSSSTLKKNLNSITEHAGGGGQGIKILKVKGLQGLSSTGLLEGIRAMSSRILKKQP